MSVRLLESETNTGGSVICVLCVFSGDGNNNALFGKEGSRVFQSSCFWTSDASKVIRFEHSSKCSRSVQTY